MADLPPDQFRSDVEDHEDVLAALDSSNRANAFAEEQLAREEEDRVAIDILQGLREVKTTEPVYWTIERLEGEGQIGLLVKWPTVLLKWERIRDEFGPGTYRVEGRTNRGSYVRRATLTIASDAPRKPKDPMQAHAQSFNITEYIAQQEARDRQRKLDDEARIEREEKREREREEREEKRRNDRQTLIIAALPAAAQVFSAMFGNRMDPLTLAAALRPPPPPDPLAMIAALKQLAPEQREQPGTLETALKIVDVVAEKGGLSGNGQTGFMDILKELVHVAGPTVGPLIQTAVERAQANAQAQQGQVSVREVAGSGGVNRSALPSAPPAPSTGDPAMLELLPHVGWLKEQLSRCVGAAAKQRDAQLYAAMFLEELPDGLTPEKVFELLSAPDWYAKLCAFDGRVAQQGPWWASMRQAILDYIRDADPALARRAVSTVTGEVQRPTSLPSLTGE